MEDRYSTFDVGCLYINSIMKLLEKYKEKYPELIIMKGKRHKYLTPIIVQGNCDILPKISKHIRELCAAKKALHDCQKKNSC